MCLVEFSFRSLCCAGKSCPSSKPKNSKDKQGDKPNSKIKKGDKTTTKSKHPRMSDLFGDDSEDDTLGQEREKLLCKDSKFSDMYTDKVRSFVKADKLLPEEMSSLSSNLESLLLYSASKSTWNKHCSAWKLFENFCDSYNVKFFLPISAELARAFVTWAVTKKNLQASTVKSYISSLNVAHTLANEPNCNLNSDPCVKMALRGASNIYSLENAVKKDRLPMNIHLLEILCHRISELSWTDFSKQIFWTACSLSFFTACRMGEIVPALERSFDPATTLTWDKVVFLENKEILILIPYTKTTGFDGKVVDVFRINGDRKCPAAAMFRLKKLNEKNCIAMGNKPVFSFPSGRNLTKKKINEVLAKLFMDFTDDKHKITGHSFRAAIPSALSSFPAENSIEDVKEWGSWESSCYTKYTKHEREKKRALFTKIVSCLYRN